MKATKYLFFLLFLLFGVLAFAADWNCKINLPPNPQNYPKELLLRMMYVDITNSEHQAVTVYLHGEVRRDGRLIGKGNSNKIEIPPGGKRITRSDITRIEKEWWDKEFEKLLFRLPTLPGGDYEACIFVYKAKGKKLLTKCCSGFKSEYVIPPKLISPENGDVVKDDFPIFRWTPIYPSKKATYKLRIVEVYPGQSKLDAMERNEAWFEKDDIVGTSLRYPISAKSFEKNKKYAWQVVAYDKRGVSLGKSEIWEYKFIPELIHVTGTIPPPPPHEEVLTSFEIGGYVIEVIHISNSDHDHFSGKGNLKLDPFGITIYHVEFSDLKLIPYGEIEEHETIEEHGVAPPSEPSRAPWIVVEGRIEFDTDLRLILSFDPLIKFHATTIYLTNHQVDGFIKPIARIYGSVWWLFPLAIDCSGLDYESPKNWVKTAPNWFSLNCINGITGSKQLMHEYSYPLVDPEGFEVRLSEDSRIKVFHNEVSLSLKGEIKLPETVKDLDGNRVSIAFEDIDWFYLTEDLTISADIAFLNNTNIALHPSNITVDFSETESPSGFTPEWKGVFFNEGELIFPIEIHTEVLGLRVDHEERIPITALNNFYVSSGGLNGSIARDDLDWDGSYRGFGGSINSFSVSIEDNTISEGSIGGTITVPFLNEDMSFAITITDEGLQEGSIEATSIGSRTINVGDDNSLTIDIIRGILSYEAGVGKLVLDLNFTFDISGIETEPIPVNGFYITSEGNIGIGSWVDLTDEVNASFHGFSLTLKRVGAGNEGDLYWLGIHGSITWVLSSSGGSEFEAKIYLRKEPLRYDHTQVNSIAVSFENDAVEFSGEVTWFDEDPTYGEGFKASLEFSLKKPSAAGIEGELIIGHKEEGSTSFNYWFIEAGVTGIEISVFPGVSIYGFTGRVFYHMRHSGDSYIPDNSALFGVYAEVPFGSPGPDKGKKYWGNTALEITVGTSGGGSSAVLTGDVYILTSGYPNTSAKIHGGAEITVTTTSFHAGFAVEVNIATLVCASGRDIELHFEESDWHIYIGTDTHPISLNFFCSSSFSASSYLMFYQNGISFGAGLDVDTGRRTWWIFYARVWGGIDVNAEIEYDSPIERFIGNASLEAGAVLGFHYDVWFAEGDCEVLSGEINANLHFETPNPTMFCGSVSARGCIVGICKTVHFDMKWRNGHFYRSGC